MTNAAQNVARRHHTVPAFYLRGFAEGDQISTIRLPGVHRFVQSVGDASVAKDFYTVDGHENGSDVIEKALSEVEGAAAAVLRSVDAGRWPLAEEDRATLGYFMALQAVRVPQQRRTLDNVAAQMVRLQIGAGGKEALRRRLEQQGGAVTDELLEDIWEQSTRPEGPPIKRPRIEHIQQMLELSQELLKYLVGRPWSLIEFDRRSLITSDAPVSLIPSPGSQPWEGVGYATAWGITFPLSRKLGLIMSNPEAFIEKRIPVEHVHRGEADSMLVGTTQYEKFFNEHTVRNASEWLFHHPEDERFVPPDLPEAAPVTMKVGAPKEFTGEPWFPRAGRSA